MVHTSVIQVFTCPNFPTFVQNEWKLVPNLIAEKTVGKLMILNSDVCARKSYKFALS